MKRIIPLLLLFMVACKHGEVAIPKDVLPPDKMKMVLSDMLIADALAETRGMGGGVNEKNFTLQYYVTIYKNNGITSEQFIKSYNFYEANPELMNRLYDQVLGEISKREQAVSK